MNNEVEDITGLFDEFFIIENETQPVAKNAAETIHNKSIPQKEETPVLSPPVPVPVPDTPPVLKEQPLPTLNYSGANKKHIAVIYNDKNNDSRENVEMLSNLITKALKYSMDDVAVVRLSRNEGVTLPDIFNRLGAKYALLWGAMELVKQEGISADIHTLGTIGETPFMLADYVHEYHGKSEYKAALWETIQQLLVK